MKPIFNTYSWKRQFIIKQDYIVSKRLNAPSTDNDLISSTKYSIDS